MPWSSTGIGLVARPAAAATSRGRCQPGSSTATAWQPARRSARQMRPIPSVALAQMVRCRGSACAPLARVRYSREHLAQRLVPGRVGVSEVRYGQGGGGRADRRRPAGGRECPQVRQAGCHVDPPGRPCAGRRPDPGPGKGGAGHTDTGTRAGPRLHVARRGELRVRLGYHPARAPEVCRQDAARRQQAASGEPRCNGSPHAARGPAFHTAARNRQAQGRAERWSRDWTGNHAYEWIIKPSVPLIAWAQTRIRK